MPDQEPTLGEAIAILVSEQPEQWQAAASRLLEHVDTIERLGEIGDISMHVPELREAYTYEELPIGGAFRCVQIIPSDMLKDRVVHRVFYTLDDNESVLVVRGRRLVGNELIVDQVIVHSTYPALRPGDPAPF